MAVMTVEMGRVGGGGGDGVTGVSLLPPDMAIKPRAAPDNSPKPTPIEPVAIGKNAIALLGLIKATLQSLASSCSVQIKLFDSSKVSAGRLEVT